MRFLFLLLTFCIAYWGIAFGQTTGNTKAERFMLKAQQFIKDKKDIKAEQWMNKAINAAPDYIFAYNELGNFYLQRKQYNKASEVFQLASKNCKNCANAFAVQLATALSQAQLFEQAERILASWQVPMQLNTEKKNELSRLKQNIQFGKYALRHPLKDTPINLGMRINSQYDEYYPSISADDSILYFTRRTGGVDDDFYFSHRDSCDDGAWLSAWDMGAPPNSPQQEGALYVSADGHYLFFMRCENRSVNGWEGGGCDLYFSYTIPEGWAQPMPFGYTINTTKFEGMPSLSSDNKEMYFVSNRDGGNGGFDIWVSQFIDGLWQMPQNLGETINTNGNETAPYIAADGKTLYFTSNGHPSIGGNDIFVTRKDASGHWSKPENLGYPINSTFDDVSFGLSADGQQGYFASDRPGGLGKMDLYTIQLPPHLQPEPYTYVEGVIYDSLSQKPIPYAKIVWTDTATGNEILKIVSNKGDGSYMAAIPVNKAFKVTVYRSAYHDQVQQVYFDSVKTLHPYTLNFALLDGMYELPDEHENNNTTDSLWLTLYFNGQDTALTLQQSDSINLMLKALPSLAFEFFVNGHSDNEGLDFEREAVSYARARNVAQLISNASIPIENIHTQGWADMNAAVANDSEENKAINRRVDVFIKQTVPN